MLRLFYRLMGWHFCEKFTSWDDHVAVCTRPADFEESTWAGVKKVRFTRRWQERKCLDCGLIHQREVRFGATPASEEGK